MMTIKNWLVTGLNLISSDTIYKKIEEAIVAGNLSQAHLQKVTGSCTPILINEEKRTISFRNF